MTQQPSSEREDAVALGIVAGIMGGLVASWAMERFQKALGKISEEMGGADGGGGQQHRQPPV